jgi:hypothetical protein
VFSIADRRWAWLSYGYGVIVTLVLAYFLLGLVVQVSDSFGNLLSVQTRTLGELIRDQISQRGYLRPVLWAQIKIVYELSGGHYYAWFRGIHVAQVALLIALCLIVIRPRTALDAALVPLSLAILIGSHTFAPMVREAFPINSFLSVAIGCVAVAALALRDEPHWYTDALAFAIFGVAALTVESGLLVWVVCAAALLLGARGLSRRGVLAMTVGVIAYFAVRMIVFRVGVPALGERASGFGFGVLEPDDLVARFQGREWGFYGYNVLSSISTVLFSEPKGGVWRFLYEISLASVHPWTLISVLSSAAATALLAWFVWTRRESWRAWTFERDDRLVMLFVVVLAANAVLSFGYAKNVIMGTAGVFLALAVHAAARTWWRDGAHRPLLASVVIFGVLTIGWSYRMAGNHLNLRWTAAEKRAEWVGVDAWLHDQHIPLQGPHAYALRDTLREDAIRTHPTPFQPAFAWQRWFDIDW